MGFEFHDLVEGRLDSQTLTVLGMGRESDCGSLPTPLGDSDAKGRDVTGVVLSILSTLVRGVRSEENWGTSGSPPYTRVSAGGG